MHIKGISVFFQPLCHSSYYNSDTVGGAVVTSSYDLQQDLKTEEEQAALAGVTSAQSSEELFVFSKALIKDKYCCNSKEVSLFWRLSVFSFVCKIYRAS